ncbi:MAG TPA: hypothetical protein VFN18_08520 [Solirubrobacterales bacterium]|nr:hypothetical protein [Solirubrobacterales bacterium]
MEAAKRLLNEISRLSPLWIVVVSLLALLSTLEATRNFDGEFEVHFHVTSVTALVIALVWLPALVRAVALTGGAVKTPAGEASAGGILDLLRLLTPDAKREILPPLAAALDSAELSAGSSRTRGEARAVRRDVERELRGSIVMVGSLEETLDDYGRKYEELRSSLPPGADRTFRMGSLMAEIRALAGHMAVTPRLVKERFYSGREGNRVVALTLLEAVPLWQCLDVVIDGIRNSRSAFEQFQALRAAEEILPELGSADRRRLADCLKAELEDASKGIDEDPSRLHPIELMLAELEAPSGRD